MRRLILVAVLVLVVALLYHRFGSPETATGNLTLAAPEPNVGSSAPRFTATDTEGKRFEVTDEGVYVLTFWSPLNQNSNRSRPGFIDVARQYGTEASFAVVYVNGARTDPAAPYDRLHDPAGRLASLYNVKRVPRLFVIRDGVVAWTLDEYYEGYERHLRRKIAEVTEDKEADRQTASRED